MRLLITNDDGIYSPGIRALAEVASQEDLTYLKARGLIQASPWLIINRERKHVMMSRGKFAGCSLKKGS